MSGIYALMDTLLPFEWLHYTFMKNALIAILLLTPLFGMLGTMAVDNKMAFFSDALGHSALTGIGLAFPLTTLIAAESTGAVAGLGMRIRALNQTYESAPMLAYVIVIGIIGITLDNIIKFLERKLTGWQEKREV